MPERAQHALLKKTLVKEWGINPWELDKLTVRDLQDVRLAEHTEAYQKQRQRERAQGTQSGSVSKKNYDTNKSRQEAFG